MADPVTKRDLADALDRLNLRLSLRFGTMLAVGLSIVAAILKLS